ncbi:hypothetical protein OCU04_000812 [Sclerotinia nivalis]|uniref:Uncharacterized protein n=1 Tax=Sclerotinia nivalis TaxID=352851 RepID=A0A9X0B003_9HELO|nr:hypothetical protein OCU04_000812 [Sclerotinia nivalis]
MDQYLDLWFLESMEGYVVLLCFFKRTFRYWTKRKRRGILGGMQKKKKRYLDVPHGFPHTASSTTGVCNGACSSSLDVFDRLVAELTQSMVDFGTIRKLYMMNRPKSYSGFMREAV